MSLSCSYPPALSDEALFAAIDGDATPEVLQHLDRCPGCTARLEEARQVEQVLSATLHRWDCPPASQLGDYHLGLLPPDQERVLTKHLALCVRCREEVEELRVFLAAEQPPVAASPRQEAVPRRSHTLVARLLSQGPGLQLAGVRGASLSPLIARSSVATIILDPLPGEHETLQLVGQIADEAGEQERWNSALVEIRQASRLVATAFVDDVGGFDGGPIAAGPTEVRVTAADGVSIVVADLVL